MSTTIDSTMPSEASPTPASPREGVTRSAVLKALGHPSKLFRVSVIRLWGNHCRVNVVTGETPASVRIPHSFFVTTDDAGNILRSLPEIVKAY